MDDDASIADVVRALCRARSARAVDDDDDAGGASTVFDATASDAVDARARGTATYTRDAMDDSERALDAALDEIERALDAGESWTGTRADAGRARTRDARDAPEMWRARFIDVLENASGGMMGDAVKAAERGGSSGRLGREAFGARAGDETLAAAAIPVVGARAVRDALRDDGSLVDDIVRRIDRATVSLAKAQTLLAGGGTDDARRGRRDDA